MKKIVCILAALTVTAVLAAALTPQEIDTFLRNHTEEGYRFVRSEGDHLWYVAFKLPEWKNEWTVAVVLVKDDSGNEILSIGTTVARSASVPSQGLMKFLLEKNGDDMNLGTFSLYYDKEYTIQYFSRIANKFLTTDQLLFQVGFVTAYCNKTEPEISKYIAH